MFLVILEVNLGEGAKDERMFVQSKTSDNVYVWNVTHDQGKKK